MFAKTEASEAADAAVASQPCGLIAQAASFNGQHVAVAELQLSATESSLHAVSTGGPLLERLPLPYALREDI